MIKPGTGGSTPRDKTGILQALEQSILQIFVDGRPADEVLTEVCLQIEKVVSGTSCSILVFDKDKNLFNPFSAPGFTEDAGALLANIVSEQYATGLLDTAASGAGDILVEDVSSSPVWPGRVDFIKKHGIRTTWSRLFFSKRQELLGVIVLTLRKKAMPSNFDKELLGVAGYLASIVVNNTHTLNELKHYQDIVLSSDDQMVYIDRDYIYRVVSNSFLTQYGLPREEIVGRQVSRVIGADLFEKYVKPRLDRCFKGEHVEAKTWMEFPPTPMRRLHSHYDPVLEGDEIVGAVVVIRDITEQTRLEGEILRSREQYKNLIEDINAIVWEAELPGTSFTFVAGPVEKSLGYPLEDWYVPGFWFDHIHPEDRERVNAYAGNAVGLGTDYEFEYRMMKKDGGVAWMQDIAHVVKDENGKVQRLRGLLIDVTEKKLAQRELEQVQESFSKAVNTSPDSICITSMDDETILEVNEAMLLSTGYDKNELIGNALEQVLQEDGAEREVFLKVLEAEKQCANHPVRIRNKDGRTFPCLLSSSIVEINGRECAFNIIRDISAIVDANESVYAQEKQLRLITDNIPVMISYVDKDLRYEFINAQVEQEFNAPRERIINKHLKDFMETSEFERIEHYIEAALSGRTVNFEYSKTREEENDRLFYEVTLVPEKSNSEVNGLYIVSTNITDRKKTEYAVRKANRALLVLDECNAALVRMQDEQQLLQSVCNIVINTGGYRLAYVGYARDDPGKMIEPLAYAGAEQGFLENRLTWADTEAGSGPSGTVIRTGKICVVPDLRKLEPKTRLVGEGLKRGFLSIIGLPLKAEGKIIGTLTIIASIADAFDEEETRLLEKLAGNISFGIQSLRETQKRLKAEGLLSLENHVFQLLASAPPLKMLLEDIVLGLESSLQDSLCSIMLLDDKGQHLHVYAAPHLDKEFIDAIDGTEIGLQAGSCGTAAFRNEPVFVSDIGADELWKEKAPVALKHGLRACHSLPIRASDGRVIGTFANYYKTLRTPESEELQIMDRMAHIVGGALETHIANERLKKSEERLALAIKGANDGLWDWNLETGDIYYSPRWKNMLGYRDEELENTIDQYWELMHPEDVDRMQDLIYNAGKKKDWTFETEFRMRHKMGHYVDILSRGFVLRPEGTDEITRIAGTHVDITERKKAEELIQQSEKRFRILYDDSPTMFFTLGTDGAIHSVNRFGADHLGYLVDELVDRNFFEITHKEDRQDIESQLIKCVEAPENISRSEFRMRHKYGDLIWVRATLRMISELEGIDILVTCEDISETRILSEQLEYQAKHDSLTQLINRAEFERRLRRVLNSDLENEHHALCYLDLDQFKIINDTCGHMAGDELLRRISNLLNSAVRKRDTLARLGGDEFAVLLEHCPFDQAERIAGDLLKSIESFRFVWEGKRFNLGVSIGLVPITRESGMLSDVMSAADAACYAAKDGGRNRVHVYHADDIELSKRRSEMHWVSEINRALEENRLRLAMQPIMWLGGDDQGKKGKHYELLLRMEDNDGNLISPGAFLPAAERYNLSVKLDRWVTDTAFAWLLRNPDELEYLAICSINLSGHSLSDQDFMNYLLHKFETTDIPPDKICFEITETAAIANLGDAIQFIQTLKSIGCCFALDDFGTGLSSFNYLKNMPVDFLKIDGSFIRNIVNDPIDLAMVRSINDIGHVMGKLTIAEFVESREILELLRKIGVNYAQGYAVSAPRPLEPEK